MPRTDNKTAQRSSLIPIVAKTFAELGYRRTTTVELAKRCKVQEPILYRLWKDKKAMFLASVDFVYESSAATWSALVGGSKDPRGGAGRLLDYEVRHHGEFGLYRIVFAALTESDDPDISRAVADMYKRFHRFVTAQVAAHRKGSSGRLEPSDELAAWGFVGLGTIANVIREFGLATAAERARLFVEVGRTLLDGRARASGKHLEGAS